MSARLHPPRDPRTVYRGIRHIGPNGEALGVEVTRGGRPLDPRPSWKVRNHSPTGFEWGYHGSGPAQLALALVLDVTGDVERTQDVYQEVKGFTAGLWGDEWTITAGELLALVEQCEHERDRRLLTPDAVLLLDRMPPDSAERLAGWAAVHIYDHAARAAWESPATPDRVAAVANLRALLLDRLKRIAAGQLDAPADPVAAVPVTVPRPITVERPGEPARVVEVIPASRYEELRETSVALALQVVTLLRVQRAYFDAKQKAPHVKPEAEWREARSAEQRAAAMAADVLGRYRVDRPQTRLPGFDGEQLDQAARTLADVLDQRREGGAP